jgi:hypothetical protein
MIFPFSQFYFVQVKQALELWEHRAKHGPDATLGPYGPYRDWPPKTGGEVDDQGVPGAPGLEAADVEGDLIDPVTDEALAPLHHEGSPRDPAADSTAEVYDVKQTFDVAFARALKN